MSAFMTANGFAYKMSAEKAYSTDSNVLGATHEAKDLERLDSRLRVLYPTMGGGAWKRGAQVTREEVECVSARGRRVWVGGRRFESLCELFLEANGIAGSPGLGMSDQIKNR